MQSPVLGKLESLPVWRPRHQELRCPKLPGCWWFHCRWRFDPDWLSNLTNPASSWRQQIDNRLCLRNHGKGCLGRSIESSSSELRLLPYLKSFEQCSAQNDLFKRPCFFGSSRFVYDETGASKWTYKQPVD